MKKTRESAELHEFDAAAILTMLNWLVREVELVNPLAAALILAARDAIEHPDTKADFCEGVREELDGFRKLAGARSR